MRGILVRYNLPLLVAYDKEAHATAGAILAMAIMFGCQAHVSRLALLGIAVGCALLVGAFKEYALDLHADIHDIPPWGLGAAAALAVRFAL